MIRLSGALLLSAPLLLAAAPAPKATSPKTVVLGPITVDGKRQVPVGFVMTRDASIKRAIDASVEQHIMDAARR